MGVKYGNKTKVKLLRRLKGHNLKHYEGPRELDDYLYKESKIDKLKHVIIKANCQFVYDQLKTNLPETFSNLFTLNNQIHVHITRKNRLILPNVKTTSNGSSHIFYYSTVSNTPKEFYYCSACSYFIYFLVSLFFLVIVAASFVCFVSLFV